MESKTLLLNKEKCSARWSMEEKGMNAKKENSQYSKRSGWMEKEKFKGNREKFNQFKSLVNLHSTKVRKVGNELDKRPKISLIY